MIRSAHIIAGIQIAVFLLGFGVGVAVAGPQWAGMEQTTHRAGDRVGVQAGCAATALGLETLQTFGNMQPPPAANAFFQQAVMIGACFVLPAPVPGLLAEWVSGPYSMDEEGRALASIWLVVEPGGAGRVYALMLDNGGRHEAARGV